MPARSAEGEPSTRAADRLTSAVPMHSAARKPGVGGSGCAWRYATPGPRSTCQALCSETPTPDEALACGHSRSGILNKSLRGAHASQVEIGRNDWAAPEPVTGWNCFVNSVARVPACLAGSRGFESRTRRQFVYIHLHTSLAQWMRAPAYEAGGRTFESCTRCHFSLDVAKWSKASACKADGDSPHPFESGRRVQTVLA